MGDKHPPLRLLLQELHCAEPLLKPLDLSLVASAVRAALQQRPSAVPSSGLLHWAQQHAQKWERNARAEQRCPVIVCAAQRRDRIYLRQLLAAAGATVIGEATDQVMLAQFISRASYGANRAPVIVTTAVEATPLAPFVAIQHLPMLALAPDLRSALSLIHNPRRVTAAWPTLGVVIDDPTDEAAVPLCLACALHQLAQGKSAIPPRLLAPFADTVLSPQEQATLLLDLQGYDSNAIAAWMKIDVSTVRQYRGRIRDKLGIAPGDAVATWVEHWWQSSRAAGCG